MNASPDTASIRHFGILSTYIMYKACILLYIKLKGHLFVCLSVRLRHSSGFCMDQFGTPFTQS